MRCDARCERTIVAPPHACEDTHSVTRALVSLCVIASACIKVPEFVPQDAPSGDGGDAMGEDASMPGPIVSVVPNGGGADVTGPGYTILFSNQGARFPYQLNPGSNLIMGGGEQCGDEFGMGIAIYPLLRVNGVNQSGMGVPSLQILAAGPYVGQVRLDWSDTLPCTDGSSSAISGYSIFSFFPNGRITRLDHVQNAAQHAAANCMACSGGAASGNFYLTSYTTLIVDSNAFMSDGALQNASHGAIAMPNESTCMSERGHSVAFSWLDGQTRLRVAAAPPTSAVRTVAFVKDLHVGTPLPAQGWTTTTQMAISTEGCPALEGRIAPFSDDDHQLVIDSQLGPVSVGAALTDGIYGSFPRIDGHPVDFPVTLSPVTTTTQPRIPAGFAVWLFHAPLPATLTLTHSRNPGGTWYREQRVNQDSVILWFDVSLEPNESITVSGS
jgi:hypothetical protein